MEPAPSRKAWKPTPHPAPAEGEGGGGGPHGRGAPRIEVEISDTQASIALDAGRIAQLVRNTMAAEGVAEGSISLAFVDEPTIHAVNRRHLDHDWPTDVISFRLSEEGDPCLAGELVISAERAAALAARHGIDAWSELALYVVHGLLHLCGHDDQTPAGAEAMRRREGEILAGEGLTNPFPLVGRDEAGSGEGEAARCSD